MSVNLLEEKLKDIQSAIDIELKTVKRYGSTSRITLFSGKKSSKVPSKSHLYRFEMLIQRSFPDGSHGTLVYRNKSMDADVVATEGQYIWLNLNEDVGERIPQAFYEVDLSFLLEDLKEKYLSLTKNMTSISGPGINLLLAHNLETSNDSFCVRNCIQYLSPEQIIAIENMLSSKVGAILGPPGTGKTRTLAGALVECFMNEEKILVCAYTNRAVDEAMNAFKIAAKECVPEHFFAAYNSGKILRKGVSTFSETEPIIKNPEEIAETLITTLQKELDEVRRKIRDSEQVLNKMRALAKHFDSRKRLQSEYDLALLRLASESNKYDNNDSILISLNRMIEEKEQDYLLMLQCGLIKRILTVKKRKDLEVQISNLNTERDQISFQQRKILETKAALKIKVQRLKSDIDKVNLTIGNENTLDLSNKIYFLVNELEKLQRHADHLEKAIQEASSAIINNAFVIFATLSRCHIDKDINNAKFDRVFVDEASMASLPPLFLAGFKAQKSICIFGDPQQLSPICLSTKEEVRKWFAMDIYQYAGLNNSSIKSVAQLETQRRMPIELGDLVSEIFYSGKLKHDYDPDNEMHGVFPWMRDRKVVILDTTAEGAFCNKHESGKGYSRINVAHAVISLSIFKEADEMGIESSKMAYITPYRAQAEFLGALVLKNREVLINKGESFLPELRWGTVHRFQGGEAELVIYDTCESPRQLPTRLTGGSIRIDGDDIEIDDSSRLHCVALSRAKSRLIVLANLGWLRNTLLSDCKLSGIINKISKMGSIISLPENHSALKIFSSGFQRDLFSADIKDVPYILCNESQFYELLISDIDVCQKSITIVSPYLSVKRISRLEEPFRTLNSKKADTTVWTKDPSDLATMSDQHKECSDYLEKLGAKVFFRAGTHEKAVIIDEYISYYGSLNPLSHRDTKETMFRIKDAAFAKALIDHLDLKEQERKKERPRDSEKSFIDRVFSKIGLKKIDAHIDEEKARKAFVKLRWVIAEDKGLPMHATLWNRTIEWLLKDKPKTMSRLYSCEEFKKNQTNVSGYENVILSILKLIK